MYTVFVKLYTLSGKSQDLFTLLCGATNQVVLPEVEPVLERKGQYNVLCTIYREGGEGLLEQRRCSPRASTVEIFGIRYNVSLESIPE